MMETLTGRITRKFFLDRSTAERRVQESIMLVIVIHLRNEPTDELADAERVRMP